MQQTDDWTLFSDSLPKDEESIMREGTRFQLANGYMGYRGTLDEYTADQQVGVTLAGIYDQVGEAWREPVNAPNGAFTQIRINGQPVHALTSCVSAHSQSISMRDAVFERNTVFRLDDIEVRIKSRRFLSIENPHLLCVEFTIDCDKDCGLEVLTGIDSQIWDLNGPHLEAFESNFSESIVSLKATTQQEHKSVIVVESIQQSSGYVSPVHEGMIYGRTINNELLANTPFRFEKFVWVTKTGDAIEADLFQSVVSQIRDVRLKGFKGCLRAHRSAWGQRWATADVLIDGDPEAQFALRYSLFQLLMVAPVKGSGNSIPARALSGQVYKGAIFWDTEFFMLPFFLHTQPKVAEDLLRYRIQTLDGARRKAASEGTGYRGAYYAWESQETGDEACTYFNVGDPFTKRDLRTHFRDKQIHISGDIALAFWDHFQVTGDDALLREGGAEVILECARFYASWIYYQPAKQRYEVLDVVGPDEYHERVHNNAFTNRMVHRTLQVALKLIAHFEKTAPAFLKALDLEITFREELDLWKSIESNLYVPQPDTKTGVIEQFDGYYQLENASLKTVQSRKLLPNEYLGAGQGVAAHTQIIKQADVIMMLHRFIKDYSTEILQANWKFYEPRTEHGSSLSACAYAIVAAAFGNVDWAYRYFLKTAMVDLEANYKMYAGTTFIGGSHPAANGGSWMAVVFGFAGLQIQNHTIQLNPHLPSHWNQLQFDFNYRTGRFKISITSQKITIERTDNHPDIIRFEVQGNRFELKRNNHFSTPLAVSDNGKSMPADIDSSH